MSQDVLGTLSQVNWDGILGDVVGLYRQLSGYFEEMGNEGGHQKQLVPIIVASSSSSSKSLVSYLPELCNFQQIVSPHELLLPRWHGS